MKNKIFSDRLKRLSFIKYELIQNVCKCLLCSDILSFNLKKSIYLEYLLLPKNCSIVQIHNICYFTGRGHGNYAMLKMSRIKFKELVSFGKLPGFIKSSW